MGVVMRNEVLGQEVDRIPEVASSGDRLNSSCVLFASPPLDKKEPGAENSVEQLFAAIKCGEFERTKTFILADHSFYNIESKDSCKSTPLIAAIKRLSGSVDEEFINVNLIISFLLNNSGGVLDICMQDTFGDTALHLAARYGLYDIAKRIIQYANQTKTISNLKKTINNKQFIEARGETSLGSIRRSDKLNLKQKKALYRLMTVPPFFTEQECIDYNSHSDLCWDTPLMECIFEASQTTKTLGMRIEVRKLVLMIIEVKKGGIDFLESNDDGHTALHYAITYGEFKIALAILAQARLNGNFTEVCNATTLKGMLDADGELPHMHLVKKGGELLGEFIEKADQFQFDCFSSNDQSRSVDEEEIRWLYENIESWGELFDKFGIVVAPDEHTEVGYLHKIHKKILKHYSGSNLVQNSPFTMLREKFDKLTSDKLTEILSQLNVTLNFDSMITALSKVGELFLPASKRSDPPELSFSESSFLVECRQVIGLLVKCLNHMNSDHEALKKIVKSSIGQRNNSVLTLVDNLFAYLNPDSESGPRGTKYKHAQVIYTQLLKASRGSLSKYELQCFMHKEGREQPKENTIRGFRCELYQLKGLLFEMVSEEPSQVAERRMPQQEDEQQPMAGTRFHSI